MEAMGKGKEDEWNLAPQMCRYDGLLGDDDNAADGIGQGT